MSYTEVTEKSDKILRR